MPIRIGTSGWHYRHWLGSFYPSGTPTRTFLDLYSRAFTSVEINNSFYRLPSVETLSAWRDAVPEDFRFAVKASRFITHNKKLKDSGDSFRLFFGRVKVLGDRLGPVLFQLPPRWKYNGDRLEEFLSLLPAGPRYVFEFRHPDWLREEAFALLKKHRAGFCIHDMPGSATPELVLGDLAYIRFHGPEGKYGGSYPDATLRAWAEKLREWSRKRKRVYCYFNNDVGGFAPKNALTLLGFLKQEGTPSGRKADRQ